ncbi:MAG: hypothetical protein LAO24_21815 [Acidobacteriia bacterium]|nr:hypothetical protein [Terriglobia bacterium]
MNYTYLFDAAWLFLAGWIIALLAVALIAFGRDVLPLRTREHPPSDPRR